MLLLRACIKTGVVSEQTLAEMASTVTGIGADTEMKRLNGVGGISVEQETPFGLSDGTEEYHQNLNDFFSKVREDG